jgi:hypothetical protein
MTRQAAYDHAHDSALRKWRARCPLRIWLDRPENKDKPGMIDRVRNQAGLTSKAIVHAWMNGVCLPRNRVIARLRPLTGITLDAWVRWYDQKPGGDAECASTSEDSTLVSG